MDEVIRQRYQTWLGEEFDEETRTVIRRLEKDDPSELEDAFYRNLEFGTGGLRGIMGVGTNRMNRYTVGMATQGFANYLRATYPGRKIHIAVAHDSRNNSKLFAEIVAHVMAANGIGVYLFEDLRPTPELSFAIRHLRCEGGVVCTASHNPREYNGYKAYWNDGGQLVPPHDKNVIAEVEKIRSVRDVRWSGGEHLIRKIGRELDQAYLDMLKTLSVNPEVISRQHDLGIVYTPIHGTGITLVPEALARFGFTRVQIVEEQAKPDGNFPTVVYPNPEESEAMALGLQKARSLDADILLGTDPDADRVGVGVKNHHGEWTLLNGNQTAVLVCSYMLEARKVKGLTRPNDMVIKTIVTTDMIDRIAEANGVACYNVLTGFKWIAEMIREKEGREHYVVGGEESYGLMVGDQLRDKDAVAAVAILCEMAAYEKDQGRSLFEKLIDLYVKYGYFRERLVSITRKGMNGQKEIAAMMESFRSAPPLSLNEVEVVRTLDYANGVETNLRTGDRKPISLPRSNVLQFILADGSKISARPSGTEPKIKFYFSVQETLGNASGFDAVTEKLDQRIDGLIASLGI